jgi:hypothetical protein
MIHTGSLRGIDEVFALPQHIHCVACGHKDTVDALESRCESLYLVEIQMNDWHAQTASFAHVARRRDNLDAGVLHEIGDDASAHLAGCSHYENACFVWHRFLQGMAGRYWPCPILYALWILSRNKTREAVQRFAADQSGR